MSDYQSRRDVDEYIAKLLDQATPNSNDIRYAEYVDYINGFLAYFGEEKVYLVGSTAEQTKLRASKDNSDADFLLVSGRLTIPVTEIELKSDVPSFVWVRGENLDVAKVLEIEMIETCGGIRYLPADILIDLDPRLFTILRGIYRVVTSTTDGVPGRQSRVTTLGERSSVGLARTEFRGLEIKDKDKIPQLRRYFPKRLPPRVSQARKQSADMDQEDLKKILELIALCGAPGNPIEHEGQFTHFTDVVKLLMARQREETFKKRENPVVSLSDDNNEFDTNQGGNYMEVDDDEFEKIENDFDLPTDVKATYTEKSMKDFVPALRVIGRLECIEKWYRENGKWLPEEVKRKICDSEIYIVAKNAPLNPDRRDFCLAFNHAEVLLAKSLTQTQRKCLLIMKGVYKGVFERIMKPLEATHRLKSFHIKTALYWLLDETVGSPIWMEENLTGATRRVLFYLRNALQNKCLLHYFARSNLFAGFETNLCTALIHGIDRIVADPIKGLENHFALDKERVVEIILTDEQVRHIIKMHRDGGVENEANALEMAMDDFQRGFTDTRKKKGQVPLREALNHVMDMYFKSEAEKRAKEELKKLKIPAPENLGGLISGLLGTLASSSSVGQGSLASPIPQSQNSRNSEDPLANFASQLLQGNPNQVTQPDNLSPRRQTSRNQEQESSRRTPEHGRQLADAVNAFFDSSSHGERRSSLEGEVKQLALSYFLGKSE